jgi:acyl dehydratase
VTASRSYSVYEDVKPGHELGPLLKGPLSAMHLMRWSAAMENWHRIHYDRDFATKHDKLPDILVNGSLKQQFIVQVLKDWAGPNGWVWKVRFQFRAMNLVDETLSVWARVTSVRDAGAFGLVDLDVGIRNELGVESTPGSAVVALPHRYGSPVPYPFRAPTNL